MPIYGVLLVLSSILATPAYANRLVAPEAPGRGAPSAAAPGPPGLQVRDGLVDLDVEDAILRDVLLAIGRELGAAIVTEGDLNRRITRRYTARPLNAVLRDLLAEGMVILQLYRSGEGSGQPPTLAEIRVYVTDVFPPDQPGAAAELDGHRVDDPAALPIGAAAGTEPGAVASNMPVPPYDNERLRYIHGLEGLRDPLTVSILADMLAGDPDPAVRRAAVSMLASIGGEDVVRALTASLGDPDPSVRASVLKGLVDVAAEDVVLLLAQAFFGDPSPDVQQAAVRMLAAQPGEPARLILESAASAFAGE